MHTVSELIRGVGELPPSDFEDFFSKVEAMRSTRTNGVFSKKELALLAKINSTLPSHRLIRWNYLIALRDGETIGADQYKELLSLTEEVEEYEAKRLGWIAELADIHGLSLPNTIKRYNIRTAANG